MLGKVINLNGGVYQVVLEDGIVVSIKARGKLRSVKTSEVNEKAISKKEEIVWKKVSPKVGDNVVVENGVIDTILPRTNELIRPDIANVDQILVVFASREPDFSFYLLDLFICNIIKRNILPIIVITKIDKLKEEELTGLKSKLAYYEELGYPVIYVNSLLKEGTEVLRPYLRGKVTVLSGQTGAGKSTLLNALIPGFSLKTQEISYALGRGKHTTRETTLYSYEGGYIGDTPGFSKLDILNIEKKELSSLFVEFKDCSCQFRDCLHQKGIKGCGVYHSYLEGKILSSRYESYLKMLEQILIKEKK